MNLSNDFGWWLAGLADGESSFNCSVYTPSGRATPNVATSFYIGLREDDRAILETIQATLGVGRIYRVVQRNAGNARPRVDWKVQSKEGCQVIRDVFRQYPLRTKKARDFAVWSQIVDIQAGARRRDGDGSLERLTALATDLRELRTSTHDYP